MYSTCNEGIFEQYKLTSATTKEKQYLFRHWKYSNVMIITKKFNWTAFRLLSGISYQEIFIRFTLFPEIFFQYFKFKFFLIYILYKIFEKNVLDSSYIIIDTFRDLHGRRILLVTVQNVVAKQRGFVCTKLLDPSRSIWCWLYGNIGGCHSIRSWINFCIGCRQTNTSWIYKYVDCCLA